MNTYSDIINAVNEFEKSSHKFENKIQVNFLRNYTVEGIDTCLKYYIYDAGFKPEVIYGNYDTIRQEILDSSSHLYNGHSDIIVLSLILDNLIPEEDQLSFSGDIIINELKELYSMVSIRSKALIAINTFVLPFVSEIGITNAPDMLDKTGEVIKINQFIRKFVKSNPSQFFLMDFDRYVRLLGEKESMDYRFWYSSKAPFKYTFLDLYAMDIVKIIKALKGKAKKCLILDCDNTLWGGIIGEDELSGIKLDRNDYPGKAFYDFQKDVIKLYEKGVLITLCSKNNENDIWEVFDKHPYSLLKKDHIAAWRINWDNKAENISSLAKELNLGLDSFVFVDDNPVECEIVKGMLPEVTVIQVPKKLYEYHGMILKDGLFDTLSLSSEDKKRTEMYKADKQRKTVQLNFNNIDDYLASLNIIVTINNDKKENIARIAQLTQKTNQFNLTTKRYSEAQIEEFINSHDNTVYTISVKDKFGDLGITGVLIAKIEGDVCIIDSLLLSCRILGRKIEDVFVNYCIKDLEKKWEFSSFKAEYVLTNKNQQTVKFWDKVGFIEKENKEGCKVYFMERNKFKSEFIKVIKIINK